MPGKSILIIDPEPASARRLASHLEQEGYSVQVADDDAEGLRGLYASPPDLLMLTLPLSGRRGTDVVQQIRNDPRTEWLPVILVAAKNQESVLVEGLLRGADDYVTQPLQRPILLARTSAVLRRAAWAQPAGGKATGIGPISLDLDRHQACVDDKPISLTLTEFRLLATLVAAEGSTLTRNQLIDQAIGMDALVTDRTIDVHLTALRRKLGKARDFLETVRGVGYRIAVEKQDAKPS